MNKKEVIKEIKKEFTKGTQVILDLDKDDTKYYFDLAIDGEYIIHIETLKEFKEEVYNHLVTLVKIFDFSFYLEFYSIEEIEIFIKS